MVPPMARQIDRKGLTMHTTERKNELVSGIAKVKAKAEAITTDQKARATIFEHLHYLDGAAHHLFAELDRAEKDTETLLHAIKELLREADKHSTWKEKTPPAEGE